MNDLCVDYGWKSIYHDGEQLCGDHVELVHDKDDLIMVLADGLGSGVKASILSTLTSKIICTMMAENMPLEECVSAIADALPIDQQKHVAYSTFTILRIHNNEMAEIVQFDNPQVIMLRGSTVYHYPTETVEIGGKKILRSMIRLKVGDLFCAVTDGCTNASAALTYNYNWTLKDVADYLKIFAPVGYTAKTLATMLMDQCYQLYAEHPIDDATACVLRIRNRQTINLFIGPPKDREKEMQYMDEFFRAEGMHIICGGTTASIASRFLGKQIEPVNNCPVTDIPPISKLEGTDLVTEGILTLDRVNHYAVDALDKNDEYAYWSGARDGASLLSRLLFESGTHINFFVGESANTAHQELIINNKMKLKIIRELASHLKKMGKTVTMKSF